MRGLRIRLIWHENLIACSVPVNYSSSRHLTEIPNLNDVFPPVATGHHRYAVVPERDGVTADLRSVDIRLGPSNSCVVNLNCVVPAARDDLVLINVVPFYAKNAV